MNNRPWGLIKLIILHKKKTVVSDETYALNITEIEDDFNIKQIPFKKTSLSIFIILIVTFCLPQSTVGIKAKLSKMKNWSKNKRNLENKEIFFINSYYFLYWLQSSSSFFR